MKINGIIDKKKSKFKLILTTFCCLVGLSCFCNAFELNANCNFVCQDQHCNCEYGAYTNPFYGELPGNLNLNCIIDYFAIGNCNNTQQCFQSVVDGHISISSDIFWFGGSSYIDNLNVISSYGVNTQLANNLNIFDYLDIGDIPTGTFPTYFMFYFDRSQVDNQDIEGSIGFTCEVGGDFTGTLIQGTGDCPSCPSQYTSLECQQEYSLIPISSVDSSYCESNNLCSSSDCPINTGDVSWSALYINNIQHLGGAIIRVDIPEEIDRDYTQGTGEFDLNIDGYNVDYEKMNEILSIQHYKPTSEDFTQAVGILAPYMKIFLFILFVFIVIKRLKKPFKSRLK